ncbi:MAG: putative Protein kinase, partial [Anaerolineales bacterium]|nr:putative Protein kinase [Anaerolineales bacterium]
MRPQSKRSPEDSLRRAAGYSLRLPNNCLVTPAFRPGPTPFLATRRTRRRSPFDFAMAWGSSPGHRSAQGGSATNAGYSVARRLRGICKGSLRPRPSPSRYDRADSTGGTSRGNLPGIFRLLGRRSLNGLIGRTISHYTILEQVGQGGMSSVFSAADLADGRVVAMKILSPYIAHEERFQARFEREIKLLSRLQHPNIIPILDFGEADGLAFIVMPYIASGTLLDRLNRGPLDPRQGGRIVDQMASALMLAHQNGVIHRDVKPSNVLVDEKGNALLSDFSFARSQDASQNLTGSALIGTPAYMSPEGCRGNVVDARSDQYSFGVMLFQITTGALPFTGGTPMATALQHINVPLPRPRAVNPNLPEEIELVLIKALAKDPALRFDSMEALNRSFQAALAVALDPQARAADGKTISSQRTLAMYRKYQNIKPPESRGRLQRSAILAALLLLAACTVSAG